MTRQVKMKKGLFFLIFGGILGSLLGSQERILLAAAANISSMEKPLKAAFEKKHPGFSLEFTFGASGALTTQILNGAPFEVFLSADLGFPQKIVESKKALSPAKVYALGKLVLLSTKAFDTRRGLDYLKDPLVKQFTNCNPETAPYGKAGREALQALGLWDQLQGKLVVSQTITQAFQFTVTALGTGLVNKSALYTKEGSGFIPGTHWVEVPENLYNPIQQAFVLLIPAGKKPGPQKFAEFLFSPEAQKVFKDFGYGVP